MHRRYCRRRGSLRAPEEIETWLSRMAAEGWRLERTGLLWRFGPAAPAQLRFAVTCPAGATATGLLPADAAADSAKRWEQDGWRRAADWSHLQIFATDRADAPRPDDDPRERLGVCRRLLLPGCFLAALDAVLLLIALGALAVMFAREPLLLLRWGWQLLMVAALLAAMTVGAVIGLRDLLWLRRARRRVDGGGPCPPMPRSRGLSWALMALAALGLLSLALSYALDSRGDEFNAWPTLLLVLFLMAVAAVLRRLRVEPETFRAVYGAAAVVALIVVLAVTPRVTTVPSVPRERLPLTMSDLGLPNGDDYCLEDWTRSPLLVWREYTQRNGDRSLWYEVWQPRTSWFRSLCRGQLLRQQDWEPAGSVADRPLYRCSDGFLHGYLLDGPQLALLWTDEPLTDEQLTVAAETL